MTCGIYLGTHPAKHMKLINKKYCTILEITALFFFFIGVSFAQEGVIVVDSRAQPDRATLGQYISFEVVVRHTMDIQVSVPTPGIEYGGLELIDYAVPDPVDVIDPVLGNIIEERAIYTVAAYDTGMFTIPPVEVLFHAGTGEDRSIVTNPVQIIIESILPADAQDILDIKEPILIAQNILLLLLTGIMFGLITAYLIYRRYRKKKQEEEPLFWEGKPHLPPHEEAIAALHELKESSLLKQGKVKEYYTTLSDIERLYMQRRYKKPFLMMTTSETKECLAQEYFPEEEFKKIDILLSECDLVKFAKYRPAGEAYALAWQTAYDIVESTKPAVAFTGMPESVSESITGDEIGGDDSNSETKEQSQQ